MGMISKEELTNFIKEHQTEFLEKYGVSKIGLLGSLARGEQTEQSDIDIAIEMAPGRKNLHNFLEFRRFLEISLNSSIDLGLEATLKPAIKNQIKKEIIYV
ncbi:MAG: nucleotidyltransferase family protein [Pseudomonadota bacterium]